MAEATDWCASDRYDVYSDSKVTRVLVCSSVTAHLTGTTTERHRKVGYVEFKNISIVRPAVGAHLIECSEKQSLSTATQNILFKF